MKNLLTIFIAMTVVSCSTETRVNDKASVTKASFGTMPDGTAVDLFTLVNKNNLEVKVITYGGIITAIKVPDREGKFDDIVLGYDNLESYLKSSPYFGAIIGRYGNRIAKGKFKLDDMEYSLATNDGSNHLHGGVKGFDKVVWKGEPVSEKDGVSLKLTYMSSDMEEGYPGNLRVTVIYTLKDDNTLTFDYSATTDKKTVVNLTNHSYYNLTGVKEDILNHEVQINAANYLPVDSTLIPTGVEPVAGTPFDFTSAKKIGREINEDNKQLKNGLGYDHCWVLNEGKDSLNFAASVYEPTSGRVMEIYTTEPAIQFYTGNFLNGSNSGKDNVIYNYRTGFCLETEHYPDSPNQIDFPNVVLNPGEEYHTTTVTKFSTK